MCSSKNIKKKWKKLSHKQNFHLRRHHHIFQLFKQKKKKKIDKNYYSISPIFPAFILITTHFVYFISSSKWSRKNWTEKVMSRKKIKLHCLIYFYSLTFRHFIGVFINLNPAEPQQPQPKRPTEDNRKKNKQIKKKKD